MKAAILKSFGEKLAIETLPDPMAGPGEIVVDVVAASVLSYACEVFSGERKYLLPLPVVPGVGGIGRVRAVGPDALRLAIGDWVFCDCTLRSRDDALAPDIALQGWSARGEASLRLLEQYRHGAFAEQMRLPLENATRLGAIEANDAARWCALGSALVPYGGFLAARLRPGEIVLVSGATGHFGSAAVAVAVAMGAAIVVATGRNEAVLADLARRFGPRVRPVRLCGDAAMDRGRMQEAAAGPIDCVLDISPPAASTATVRAAAMAVRPNGRIVLMGGVGGQGGDDLALPYPWIMRNGITIQGQWMYPRDAVPRLAALARSGLLDLAAYEVTGFALDDANEAVSHAAATGGPFKLTVIEP